MVTPLLIVTPQANFGALIRKNLDAKRYNVLSTPDFSEAIQFVRRMTCALAILDAEMDDVDISILDIGFALRQINPAIQFVVINSDKRYVQVQSLNPVAVLTKPVSFPELQKILDRMLAAPAGTAPLKGAAPSAGTTPESGDYERILAETTNLMWLKDVSKAAQHLTRLTHESSAQAALITRENELWAYAGQLSREAAQELSRSIQRYWDKGSESDLLRFVRLESTEAQHMLYARKLSHSMILALVFDAETPFSTIRAQASKLVRILAENNPFESEDSAQAEMAPPAVAETRFKVDDDEQEDIPPISELLGDVPPPIPPRHPVAPKISFPWERPRPVPAQPQPVMAVDEPKTTPPPQWTEPNKSVPVAGFSRETSPAVPVAAIKQSVPSMAETVVSRFSHHQDTETRTDEIPNDVAVTRKHEIEGDIQTVIETRPQAIAESMTEVAHRILLEPASPELVNLTYACLLVPRFDHHLLVGDAADRLTAWVPQVCVAFSWRLEHLAVRPDYLQWVVRVPPSTAPGYLMRIIRQQTSERLFNEFPKFKEDNIAGDFWAPGYLIMGSSQPHPQKLVRDFIRQTRDRQGISR